MRRWNRAVVGVASFTLAVAPFAAAAQSATNCSTQNADACQKAEDLYKYLFPQFGTALAGGHPVLGSSDVIGGLGKFSIGVRATAVWGSIPQTDNVTVSTTGRVASNIETEDQFVPAPAIDAAIGLFKGFPLGVTRVGGLDALVTVVYVPNPPKDEGSDEAEIEFPDGNTAFGFGARVGLLQESILVPGVSVTYLRRPLPKVTFRSETDDGATIGVQDLDIAVSSWRIIATKSLVAFALSAGIGGDKYNSDGFISAAAPGVTNPERIGLDQSINRTNWFVDLTLNLWAVHLGFEYGGVRGGNIATFNTFDPSARSQRKYVSAALRFGW